MYDHWAAINATIARLIYRFNFVLKLDVYKNRQRTA